MKKLMITAAALLTACVVGAAVQGGTRVSGTDFNSYPTGAFNPALDDDGSSDMGTYWTTTQAGESVVEEETQGDNILKIDESVPLYRNMYKSNADEQSATVSLEQSVYFQSKVKFTASEDETITPSEGDKLIVWVRATEENPTTNLIVTAGIYEDGQWGTTNYVVDQSIDVDDWHDLEIVAKMDDSVLKFEVKVDGSAVTSDETTLFPSLDQYSDYKSTITCAGFKGSGYIDDLEFGTIAENPTKYYEVDGDEYITFAAALEAAASAQNPTIKLINDAVLEYDDVAGAGFTNDDDLVIDLAGCTISCEGVVFVNEGTLTILDTVGGGSVENTAENAEDSIENYGGDVYISGGMYLGAVYNDDDSGSIVVTLNGDPAELVLDDDSESDTYGYWVIQTSGEQPPEPTTYELTIPTVTGASATVTDKDTGDEIDDLAEIEDGTVVTVTWEADDGYKITAGATEEITMDDDKTADTPTVVAITYVTLTITPVENCTIVVSNATEEVATGATFDVDDAVELTVYRTPAEGYELDNCDATEAITMDQDQTVTAAVKQSGGGSDYPSYINPSDADAKAKYDDWKETYGADTGSEYEEAFLLNCAPAEVATEEAAFKFTAIYQDSEGNWVAEMPEKNTKGSDYNGTVTIKRYSDVGCTVESATGNFFKATLD